MSEKVFEDYQKSTVELFENGLDIFNDFKIPKALTSNWIFDQMIPLLKEKELDLDSAIAIVSKAVQVFKSEPLLVDLEFSKGIKTVVVGDIHGQFWALRTIFRNYGRPGPNKRYIFNGDIIDRGLRSSACLLVLLALKIADPTYIYITRGNHESRTYPVTCSSFAYECVKHYNKDFFELCHRVFDEIPLAYTLNKTIFIAHGGLPENLCLDYLRSMPKDAIKSDHDQKIFMALIWNDPCEISGYSWSERGDGIFCFGPEITQAFLAKHNLKLFIRSHQLMIEGYEYSKSKNCLTIFSSPNYMGEFNNAAAVAFVNYRGKVKIKTFKKH